MINDALARLSGTSIGTSPTWTPTAQAITVTAISDYAFDTRSPTNVNGGTTTTQMRDLGEGQDLYVSLTVGTAFTAGGAATLTPTVELSDDLSGTNTVVIGTFGTLGLSVLKAGANFVARINPRLGALGTTYRYIIVRYTVATGPMTAGAVFADIVTDIYDSTKFYGSGFKMD